MAVAAQTFPAIVDYLLRRHLITPQQVVDGGLRVSDASRRNTNFRVESSEGSSYLLKQGVGAEQAASVSSEAAIYSALNSPTDFQDRCATVALSSYLPPYHGYDPHTNTLVLSLLRRAETLGERHARTGKFSVELARQVARALATLHSIGPEDNLNLHTILASSPYAYAPHWVLSIHRPRLQTLTSCSIANIEVIKIIQSFPDICDRLDELRAEWRESYPGRVSGHRVPIHSDLKWSNILTYQMGRAGDAPSTTRNVSSSAPIKLVDWEMARTGDPCWDVGSFLGEYLTFWILAIPVTGQDPPDRFLRLARYALHKMHPAISAFWHTYVRAAGLHDDPEKASIYLDRSVRYAAIRLVQTAYEQCQNMVQITGSTVLLLQVASNILRRPAEASQTLFGIRA